LFDPIGRIVDSVVPTVAGAVDVDEVVRRVDVDDVVWPYAASANEPIVTARGVRVQVPPPTRNDVIALVRGIYRHQP
jgi:hypothetical protein